MHRLLESYLWTFCFLHAGIGPLRIRLIIVRIISILLHGVVIFRGAVIISGTGKPLLRNSTKRKGSSLEKEGGRTRIYGSGAQVHAGIPRVVPFRGS